MTHWNRWCGSPIWSADGQEILFIRAASGTGSRIWTVSPFRDAEASLVEEGGEGSTYIAFSAQTNRLVYSKGADDQNIWRMSINLMSSELRPNRSAFFFQAEDGIRDHCVTGVQTCALPI